MNELKVDKSLLVNNFETYKLSLEKFNLSKENISDGIRIKYPNENQFSFLHHKEFSYHNHLYDDPWNANDVYFITSGGKIKKGLINYQIDRFLGLIDVWEIPKHSGSSNCNVSLSFPSLDLAVLTDGNGHLYIIETSNRNEIERQWKVLHAEEISSLGSEFKVICCNLPSDANIPRELHCILSFISPVVDSNNSCSDTDLHTSGFETVLKWIIFSEDEGKWKMDIINEFKGRGSVDYISLESHSQAFYLISEAHFESPLLPKDDDQPNDPPTNPDYEWQQSSDEVNVWIDIASCKDKSDLKIATEFNSLSVSLKEESILAGSLFHRIDPSMTAWTFDQSRLQVTMQKEESGMSWSCLLTDSNKVGKEIINEELVAEVHNKLAHLCSENEEHADVSLLNSSELEECDAFAKNRFLWRYDKSGKITHKVSLGSDQWLFKLRIGINELPAFCIRHDVDGLVWHPQAPNEGATTFDCTHIHTFPALGYIVASKQEKKFIVAPSNMSYAAVVNSVGHVIVYRKTNISDSSVLRNRKTNQIANSLYVQNLINLDSNNPVYGAYASNKYLFVLTSNELFMICIHS